MRFAFQTLGLLCLLSLGPGRAIAQSDPDGALGEARARERNLEFDAALRLYEETASAGAGTRAGRRAEQRAELLRQRRDPDGAFASLRTLERMRRDEPTDARLAELARAIEEMPAGVVRDDALFLLAEAWFRRRQRPRRALPVYEELRSSPTLTAGRRRTVSVAIAEARVALGEIDEAVDALRGEGLDETFEGRALSDRLARSRARGVAGVVLAVALLVVLFMGRPQRARRSDLPRLSWRHVGALAYVVLVPALIAELYEPGMSEAFLYFGAIALPLLALAVFGGRALARDGASARRRALFLGTLLVAQLAGAWLALDLADGLGGFGFP